MIIYTITKITASAFMAFIECDKIQRQVLGKHWGGGETQASARHVPELFLFI